MRRLVVGVLSALAIAATAAEAQAFCGFYVSGADTKLYNNATQVVLMREGTRTVLSMQNNYQGPPEDFALVVPVPIVLQKENVKTLPRSVFEHVDQLAAPRLVEYWEQDPCPKEVEEEADFAMRKSAEMAPSAPAGAVARDHGVKIEAQFAVGEYQVVVLSAQDSGGLDAWLRENKYKIPSGAEPYLRPYVQSGSKFFVARVDVKKVQFQSGMATLSPLRFHYDSERFTLPIRLGLINAQSAQDLIVHVLARGQRYEAANYPNAFIPTNLNVHEGVRDKFGPFYAALFDRTLERKPRAVVTEYSWDSGTCDPCPTPPLEGPELALLGADVLGKDGREGAVDPYGFVLTRLHARYTKDTLGEDVVFRAAPPVAGGREHLASGGRLEEGAVPASQNNFQGRYAMRHPWTGPIECDNPRRGVWGGPPGGGEPKPRAASNIAFVARGAVQLASVVQEDVPEIGLKSQAPPNSGTHGGKGAIPGTDPGPRGCGSCSSGGADAGLWVLAVPVLALLRRRRADSTSSS